jgi:hypothetical protein
LTEAGSAVVDVGRFGVFVKRFGGGERGKAEEVWGVLPKEMLVMGVPGGGRNILRMENDGEEVVCI